MNNILILDNYDSFTYNLVHIVEKIIHGKVDVKRNDKITLAEVEKYEKIILSPGPGLPKDSNILMPLIRQYASSKNILGVCLGQQAIAEVFGGTLKNLSTVFHGVATKIFLQENVSKKDNDIFNSLPTEFEVGRYHSWVVNHENFSDALEITAKDEWGNIMALQHREYNVQAVQFHPESVLTPLGGKMIENWLK